MSYLQEVVTTVRGAGDQLFKTSCINKIIDKGSVENYVTNVDLQIEQRLREELGALIPEADFIGEESNSKNASSEYAWIVDPIDGTANFVRGIKECCISVGLVKNGNPVLGVVYAPWLCEMYAAEEGCGATLNGEKIVTSKRDFRTAIHYMSSSSYNKDKADDMVGFIKWILPTIEDVRRFGSAAMALCNIAAGRIETYFVQGIYPWDICAGLCILKEAGGNYLFHSEEVDVWKEQSDLMAANSNLNLEQLYSAYDMYYNITH